MKLTPDPGHRRTSRAGGFTLIEVLVVVAILGLLAALIVPNVVAHADKARREKAVIDCVAIADAARAYYVDRGRVPTLEQLTERIDGHSYLRVIPKDPWGGAYELLTDGRRPPEFEVRSPGNNGSAGDDDDVSSKAAEG
ncbi:MAG: type II secretion system protein GspG [bacterium]|nr:type II secretion system protein GspG [bacterium]